MAYTSVDSPLGPLVVAATPKGLVRVSYTEFRGEDEVLEELARRVSPRVLEAPARLDPRAARARRVLRGTPAGFDVPIDWSYLAGFTREVLRATARDRVRRGLDLRGVAEAGGQPARGPRGRQRARLEPDAGGGARATACCAPAGRSAATRAGSSARSSCCAWRARCSSIEPFGRGGRVAEGTRLLSEYGGKPPSRVRIPPSPLL